MPKKTEQKGQIHPPIFPANSLKTLLEFYGCIAIERQLMLKEFTDTKSWEFDRDACIIRFEPDLLLDARVLGIGLPEQQKWTWSWANPLKIFTDRAMEHALQLRSYGTENKIAAFTMDSLPANQSLISKIGIIATVLCKTSGHFFIPDKPRVILVTVNSPLFNVTPPDDEENMNWVTSQFTTIFKVNEKAAIANYLFLKNFQITVLENELNAVKANKNIIVEFDQTGKLMRFNGKIPSFRS